MNKLLLILLASFSLSALGTELKVATITSNINRDTTEFFLEIVEDGSIDGLHILTKNARGVVTEDRRATVEEVVDSGFVVFREGNRDAVVLKVKNFTPQTGGEVIVDYLYSGVNNSRRQLKLGLKKTDADFFLHTTSGRVATMLRVYGNWAPILGLIGVSDIRVLDWRWWYF